MGQGKRLVIGSAEQVPSVICTKPQKALGKNTGPRGHGPCPRETTVRHNRRREKAGPLGPETTHRALEGAERQAPAGAGELEGVVVPAGTGGVQGTPGLGDLSKTVMHSQRHTFEVSSS